MPHPQICHEPDLGESPVHESSDGQARTRKWEAAGRRVLRRCMDLMILSVVVLPFVTTLAAQQRQVTSSVPAAELVARGTELIRKGHKNDGLALLVEARGLYEDPPLDLELTVARTHLELAYYDAAIDEAWRFLERTDDPSLRAEAYSLFGQAVLWRLLDSTAPMDTKTELKPAEEAFVNAIGLSRGARNEARYWLARVLHMTGRNQGASTLLEDYWREGSTRETATGAERLQRCVTTLLQGGVLEELPPGGHPPRVVSARPFVEYTEMADLGFVVGKVVTRVLIGRDGKASCIQVVEKDFGSSSHGWGLTRQALATIGEWEYEPASIDGEPVPAYLDVVVEFSMARRGRAAESRGRYVKN